MQQQGGSVEDLFEMVLSAYLYVPSGVLVWQHREGKFQEHCYDTIRTEQDGFFPKSLHGWKERDRSGLEANATRRKMLTAVYSEMCSFSEPRRRRVEQEIPAGGERLYEEKRLMLMMKRLH